MEKSPSPWKWIAILTLLILVALPLLAVVLGILWVAPVKVKRSYAVPTIQAFSAESTATPLPASTVPDVAPTDVPQPTSPSASSAGPTLLSIVPDTLLEAFAISSLVAGLTLLVGAIIVAAILRKWPPSATQLQSSDRNKAGWVRVRVVLLALIFWIGLSVYLVFDISYAVSLYPKFVAIYAAVLVLAGALLLYGRSRREKALILTLLLTVVVSVRFIDWNSRKLFLKHFFRIREGMTESQTDQIMSGYMKGYFGGPPPSLRDREVAYDEQGKIVTGWVTYRHTKEGWADSDWGEVTFESGHVVQTRFLPD